MKKKFFEPVMEAVAIDEQDCIVTSKTTAEAPDMEDGGGDPDPF